MWIYLMFIGTFLKDVNSQGEKKSRVSNHFAATKTGEFHYGGLTGNRVDERMGHYLLGSKPAVYYTDSCDYQGAKAIGCDEGYVIKVQDVRCLPLNITCSEKQIIARLCDGLRSCSNIDLRRQLYYHCKEYPHKKVYTSFMCLPDRGRPHCRTNVCSEETPDIRCRREKVFHLLGTKCYHGKQDCSPDVYMAIYRWCEGQRSCALSTLRMYIPPSVCNNQFLQHENLFMDYICVDKAVVADKCTGEFITQTPRFGILVNPGYPNNPHGINENCYWAIYPDDETHVIDVTIHLSYSPEENGVCDSKFLQLQYTMCETGKLTTEPFCDRGRINIEIHSCGTVYVTHYKYDGGESKGNRFLVSYSVHKPNANVPSYDSYSHQCEKLNSSLNTAKFTMPYDTPAPTTEETNQTTQRAIPDEDQLINDSSASSPEVEQTKDKKKKTYSGSDPWRFVTLLRVVVVNIFLGLLIIALIMALAFVCYRYKTYGRNQNRPASKSETVTTLDDKQSTEMQLLPGDNDKSPQSCRSQNANHAERGIPEREPLQNNESGPVTSSYETTIFHFNNPSNMSDEETMFYEGGTGVSSFLPHPPLRRENNKNNNTESAYSSLDAMEDVQDVTDYTELNSDSSKVIDKSPNAQLTRQNSNDTCASLKETLPHYRVNDDDYAVVIKSLQHRKEAKSDSESQSEIHSPAPSEQSCASRETLPCRGKESHSNSLSSGSACGKPIAHIHPVPEDSHIHTVSPTTMHVIPEHDCLLHKIPPPPPPAKLPPSHLLQGLWGSPSKHNKNVDWHTQHYV